MTRAESHSATQCDGVRITGHDGLGRRLSTIPIGRRARRYDGSTDVNDDRTFRDKGVRLGSAGPAAQAGVRHAVISIRKMCQGWRISSVASLYNLPSFPFAYSAKEAAISPAEASTISASAWPSPK